MGNPRKRDLRALPELQGWLTFTEAAEELGISRQRFYQLAEAVGEGDVPRIQTARRLGARPTYIVREAEVRAIKSQREGTVLPALLLPGEEAPVQLMAGGVIVTGAELHQAIAILETTAASRGSFRQAMAKAGNPLATSDYMDTARWYAATHPGDRGLSTKQLLLRAYKALLGDNHLAEAI